MKKKKWIGILIACILIVGSTMIAHAETTSFEKLYVRGDRMTLVWGAIKETDADLAIVYISNIFTANGGFSTYSRVIVAADLYTEHAIAEKGYYTPIEIPGGVLPGDSLSLYAQGNTKWLDCQISGTYNGQ